MRHRRQILFAVLAVSLFIAAVWSYQSMADNRRTAFRARRGLERCQNLAAKIQTHRTRPSMASEHERLASETTGIIEHAARSAGISPASITRITPEPQRRVGDTVYKEKPTQVLFKNVTLKQIVATSHALAGGEKRLHPKSLRLSAPRDEDTGNLWTAEMVLTYLIYDPPRAGDGSL